MTTTKRKGTPAATSAKETVPLTCLCDPDSTDERFQGCLDQYRHSISAVRVLLGRREHYGRGSSRQAIMLACRHGIPALTRVEPSMGVMTRGALPLYLDLCAGAGVNRVQFREGTLQHDIRPREAVALANERNLEVQFEIDDYHPGSAREFRSLVNLVDIANAWLDSGAVNLVGDVTTRVRYDGIDPNGDVVNMLYAELLVGAFGVHTIMLKAPTPSVQLALLNCVGEEAHLCEVPFTEVARLEALRSDVSRSVVPTEELREALAGDLWSDHRLAD